MNSRSSVRPISSAIFCVCGRESGQLARDLPLADAERRKEESSFRVGDALDHGAAGGVLAVTVAPGSTPPELSFTTPPISPVLV